MALQYSSLTTFVIKENQIIQISSVHLHVQIFFTSITCKTVMYLSYHFLHKHPMRLLIKICRKSKKRT